MSRSVGAARACQLHCTIVHSACCGAFFSCFPLKFLVLFCCCNCELTLWGAGAQARRRMDQGTHLPAAIFAPKKLTLRLIAWLSLARWFAHYFARERPKKEPGAHTPHSCP